MVVTAVALHPLTTDVLLMQLGAGPSDTDAAHDAYTSVTVTDIQDDVGWFEVVVASFEVTALLVGVAEGLD